MTEHDTSGSHQAPSDCCVSPIKPLQAQRARAAVWATGGSMLSAILASACCWVPLLAIALGTSAAGVGAFFDQIRPYFLTLAGLLLAAGFYFLYVRKEPCGPDGVCATGPTGVKRVNRAVFWVAVAFIGAFAFFPNYVGSLLGGSNGAATTAVPGSRQITLRIEDMTCEACAVAIRHELERVTGVRSATVNFDRAVATVAAEPQVTDNQLVAAVAQAGYRGTVQPSAGRGDK